MALEFHTVVVPCGPAGAIELTDEQAAQLGPAKQPPVTLTIGGKTVRVRVSRMSGAPCVFLSKANREVLGVEIGDAVKAVVALDTEDRVITPPAVLQQQLDVDAELRAAWEKLSYSHQREWATAIDDAKRDETKQRRLAQLRSKLLG